MGLGGGYQGKWHHLQQHQDGPGRGVSRKVASPSAASGWAWEGISRKVSAPSACAGSGQYRMAMQECTFQIKSSSKKQFQAITIIIISKQVYLKERKKNK